MAERSNSSTGEKAQQADQAKTADSREELGLLTVSEVAEYLQVKKTTIYNWAKDGTIPALKTGRLWHFRQEELEAWLEDHTTRPWD